LGKVLESSDTKVSLRVPRDGVAEAAGWLLANYSVSDLQVEEEDVGTIIERIMAEGPVADAGSDEPVRPDSA
jgi:ABC-type uncharacterized transport system ATPase subunit